MEGVPSGNQGIGDGRQRHVRVDTLDRPRRSRLPSFLPGAVYGSTPMSRWTEGVLALVVVLAFGLAMQLFVGDSPGAGDGGGGPGTVTPEPPDPEAAARGQAVMETAGCFLCHSVDGTPSSAPTFKGLAGSSRPLEGGEFVTADNAYLANSIIDPGSQVVLGYANLMPDGFGDTLTPEQIDDIVAYINSLAS